MKELGRILVAALIGAAISVGVCAQKGNDNRPPKDQPRVVDKEKDKTPPSNNNQSNSNSNRKKP